MQGLKRIFFVLFAAFLINSSHLLNGVDIEWKDPGETVGSRQTRDVPSRLSSIRDKLLNVTRFANGLAVAESVAVGNISFGRIVTELMVADQFAPGTDWVSILAASSGLELDRVLSAIGSFEGFLEGNIAVDFSDIFLANLVLTILQGKKLSMMKKQIESQQSIMNGLKIEAGSFDNVKGLILDGKLEATLESVPLLILLPEALQSYSRLRDESDVHPSVLEGLNLALEMVQNNQIGSMLKDIDVFIQGVFDIRNNSDVYLNSIDPTTNLRISIKSSNSSINLTRLNQIAIEDTSNILLLLSFSGETVEHVELLENGLGKLASFEKLLDNIQWDPARKVGAPGMLSVVVHFSGAKNELKSMSDLLKTMKPGAELMELAKKLASSSFLSTNSRNTPKPSLTLESFLMQSKLFGSFIGTQSFVESARFSNSIGYDNEWKYEIEELISFEMNIANQMIDVRGWLEQLQFVNVVLESVKSIESMTKNGKNFKTLAEQQKLLNKQIKELEKFGQIVHRKTGFKRFIELLNGLRNVPKWKEFVIKLQENHERDVKESGLVLFHISKLALFLKEFLQIFGNDTITLEMLQSAYNIKNLEKVPKTLNYIKSYFETTEEVLDFRRRNMKVAIENSLAKQIAWKNITEMIPTEVSTQVIEDSLKLIDDLRKAFVDMEENEASMKQLHNDIEVLDGVCKASDVMNSTLLKTFEENLKQMRSYKAKELTPSSNISSIGISKSLHAEFDGVSLLDSLVSNLRAYSDLIFGLDSVKDPIKLSNEILVDQGVPDEVKEYLKKFQDWFGNAENLEILSEVQVELNFVSLLKKITTIKEKLQSLIGWLSAVPMDTEPVRVRRSTSQSSPMSGNPQEGKYDKLKHFIEKAQDPKTTEAIKQLGKDLTRLAGIFDVKRKILTTARVSTCQENPSGPSCKTTNSPPNVNSAHNQINDDLGMSLEASNTEVSDGEDEQKSYFWRNAIGFSSLALCCLGLCTIYPMIWICKNRQIRNRNVILLVWLVCMAGVNVTEGGELEARMLGGKPVNRKTACVFTHFRVSRWCYDNVSNDKETEEMPELAKEIAGDTTIVVHCCYGLDRTMTFIGIEYGYQRHTKSSSLIDKITIFNELRKMRCGAISKQAQFYFMYYGICRLWICESDFLDLKQQYLKQSCKAGKDICEKGPGPSLNGCPKFCACVQFMIMPNGVTFIATQGPTQNSVDHFLEMLFQYEVKVVCMLCKCIEPDPLNPEVIMNKCGDYLRLNEGDGDEALKSSLYTVTRKEVPCEVKGVIWTELAITRLKDKKQQVVTHFWNTEWPDHKLPTLPVETVRLMRLVKMIGDKAPLVVHCSAGVGRTVSFIGMEFAFQKMTRRQDYPDRSPIFKEFRDMRFASLPEVQQLYFIFFGLISVWKDNGLIGK